MTPAARTILAAAALLAGLLWSLPMQTGRVPGDAPAPPVRAAPRFDVEVRRDAVFLRGHTRSPRHEDELRRAASRSFPEMRTQAEFTPLGVAPDWWDDATTALVASLSKTQLPAARLRENRLRIEAFAVDRIAARRQLESLRKVLPDSVELSIDVSAAAADADALCNRTFALFEHAPIGFEESRSELLTSAYPVLDRIVALADACRNSTLSITGHTDSSGSADWNRRLSLARANAVADYLAAHGIDHARFAVTGAGSSFPVADNETRYGRSINRRIEVRFAPPR